MKNAKRFSALLAVLLALTIVLSACGGSPAPAETNAPTSAPTNAPAQPDNTEAEKEPVTVEFWTISLQPAFTDLYNRLIAEYEEANPHVTVKWVDLPYTAIHEKLVTAIAGGSAPDVVNLNSEFALSLASEGALVDLNVEATEEQRSIYIESLYNSCSIGDSVYAFPWYGSPNITIYNTQLLAEAGIELPKDYSSEESFELARQMKDKTGAYLYNPQKLRIMLQYDGIDTMNEDFTAATLNNEEIESYINRFRDMVAGDYFPAQRWGEWNDECTLYATGKLAVINSSGSTIARLKEEAPDIYAVTEVAMPMVGALGEASNPLMNVVVPTASKNHEEAIKFANYITNDYCQLALCHEAAVFPSTKAACEDPFFTSDSETLEGRATAMSAKASAVCADFTLHIKNPSGYTKIMDDMEAEVITNMGDVKNALAVAEADLNKLLSE